MNNLDCLEFLIYEKGVDFVEYGNGCLMFKCDFFFVGINCFGIWVWNFGIFVWNLLKIYGIFFFFVIG